jgi:signal transduction histidine kinase
LFRSLRLKEEIGESAYMVNSLQTIAQTLAAAGRAQEGLVYARRAVDSAEAMGAKAYQRDALAVLVTVYDSLGRHKEALRTHRKLADLRDSLMSDESLKRTFQLQAQYESEKKDKQILGLTKDRELQDITRRMLLALGAALVLGLTGLYSRYRLKASSEIALQGQNAEILRQQELLEGQAADIETANTALQEKNLDLEYQQEVLEVQAQEIEIANTALQEKNLELEHLNNEKNEFLGIAAHDLKNPLTHIIMATGTATRYYDRMTDNDIQGQLHSIGVVAVRMTEIITNILDVNAIERGALVLHPTVFDVAPKVRAIVEDYTSRAEEKHITLHFALETPSSLVLADEPATNQVLDNIISNAVKYSPHGKNVFVRVKASNGGVRIEVQDEGPGISSDDMKKLFGKFVRLSARPTGGEHSTGLGLSIVKRMVEAMNGKVWCESEFGDGLPNGLPNGLPTGATFIVELPASNG